MRNRTRTTIASAATLLLSVSCTTLVDPPRAYDGSGGAAKPATLRSELDGCPQDLDGDGVVGSKDLAKLLGMRGPCSDCPMDFNRDGVVDDADVAFVLDAWGPCD